MSISRILPWLAPALVLLTLVSSGYGQVRALHDQPTSPLELGYFDHDLQFFAPAEISNYGGEAEPPVGWYVNYNRVYWFASFADTQTQPFSGKWNWGNRWNLGFMTEADHGWDVEYVHFIGPQAHVEIIELDPMDPTEPPTTRRSFVNTLEVDSFELSKTFRLKQLHDGSFVEPFIGARFAHIADSITIGSGRVTNDIIGAQLGCRWFKETGRWTYSAAARIFPGQNFQHFPLESADQFVIAGEIRGDAAFHFTRDISVVSGFDVIHFGRGLARGDSTLFNDQDLTMAGFHLGLQLNR